MAQHRDHQVGGYELAFVVHEHDPVGVAVIDYSHIGTDFPDELLERLYILEDQGVGLMVREAAVHLLEDVCR